MPFVFINAFGTKIVDVSLEYWFFDGIRSEEKAT